MFSKTFSRAAGAAAVLVASAMLIGGSTNPAAAQQESGCLQTNHGLVCNVVKTWTCTKWATGSASFGWTGTSVGALCESYTETTVYYYNAATTSGGGTIKPLY